MRTQVYVCTMHIYIYIATQCPKYEFQLLICLRPQDEKNQPHPQSIEGFPGNWPPPAKDRKQIMRSAWLGRLKKGTWWIKLMSTFEKTRIFAIHPLVVLGQFRFCYGKWQKTATIYIVDWYNPNLGCDFPKGKTIVNYGATCVNLGECIVTDLALANKCPEDRFKNNRTWYQPLCW